MRIKQESLLMFSGLSWFGIGFFLLSKGLRLLVLSSMTDGPLVRIVLKYNPQREQAVVLLIAAALFIGFFKGRFALRKSALRIATRIRSFPGPLKINELYPRYYYFLISTMVFLGMSMRFLPLPIDIKGFVDTVVGTALLSGSLLYFRLAMKKIA
jgi:hypothetical protein